MDRDPKTGQFIRNNKASIGNRGNRQPKWGNQNAVVHGLCSSGCYIDKRGRLVISNGRSINILPPGTFKLRVVGEATDMYSEYHENLSGKSVEIFLVE